MQQMAKGVREQIIVEDFHFLSSITVHNIDGKLMMGDSELPYNVGAVFYEKDFVRNWLMSFALGNNYGKNYFNADAWFALTDKGMKHAMVVDDNHKPLLLIPPVISSNMTPRDYAILRVASQSMQQVAADTLRKNDPNANLGLANRLVTHFQNIKRLTLTEMINPEFYAKHGIIPEVEQQVYYLKDNINEGKAPIADITRSRVILYKNHRNEPVTKEEKEFLTRLSRGSFTFKNDTAPQVNSQPQVDESLDPLEC